MFDNFIYGVIKGLIFIGYFSLVILLVVGIAFILFLMSLKFGIVGVIVTAIIIICIMFGIANVLDN